MGFEIGKTVAGYEIVEVLGTSKTGVAYKVRNVFAQRFEVLKILPKSIQDDEEQNARFLREIKVHAQLLHPNIVTFYNAREVEGQLVMTKEFVPGITLVERLQAGPIAWRESSRYAANALAALEYAHAHGIIHRGFSSSDLIITDEGIARLAGFGFAKSVSDPELTAAGVVIGALKYVSPEQVKGDAIDARCDIYSLGIVLYEMLVGKVPFDAKSQFEIMMAQVNTPPKHVSDVNASVPRELGDLVAKALAKSPDERFQTAREFREAVEHFSSSQDAVATESKTASLAGVPTPVPEAAPLTDTVPPSAPPPLPDAWALESALELAESKLAAVELQSAQPVADRAPFVGTWAATPSNPWVADTKLQSISKAAVTEAPQLSTVPVTVPNPAVDWWSPRAAVALPESKSAITVLEPEQPIVEAAVLNENPATVWSTSVPDALAGGSTLFSAESQLNGMKSELEVSPLVAEISELLLEPAQPVAEAAVLNDAPAIVSPTSLPETHVIESAIASADSQPTLTESTPELESEAAIAEPPLVPQTPVLDWWALNSQLAASEPNPSEVEFTLTSPEPEPATPEVAQIAITDPPAVNSPTPAPDLWTTEWSPAPVESTTESAQLELLSAALEPARVSLEEMNIAEGPVSHAATSHPDLWMAEPLPDASDSKPAATDLAFSSLEPEPKQLASQHEELAEEPVSLWTSGPPDTWVSEPVTPTATAQPEAADQHSLSAAIEPPPVESPAPIEVSAAPPILPQEPQVLEFETSATEPAPQPAAENPPQVVAATAAAGASPPIAPKTAQANSDLLTALFGDTLLSRVSLALVICAITFFLGTVTLFAVLSVSKP